MKPANTFRRLRSAMRGFTLLELMTAVAILGILLGIGVPAFNNLIRGTQIAAESSNLMLALTLARSEAVKRGIRVSVCPPTNANANECDEDGDWNKGWMVFADDFGDSGVYDPSDFTLQIWQPPANDVAVTSVERTSITFDRIGRAEFEDTFEVTKAGCIGDQRREMKVGFAGRVSLTRTICP